MNGHTAEDLSGVRKNLYMEDLQTAGQSIFTRADDNHAEIRWLNIRNSTAESFCVIRLLKSQDGGK